MKISIHSIPDGQSKEVTVEIDATPQEMMEMTEFLTKNGFVHSSTPAALLAQACFLGKHSLG